MSIRDRLNRLQQAATQYPPECAASKRRLIVVEEGEPLQLSPSCTCGQTHHVKRIVIGKE